jgi:hypothetical protein
MTIADPRRRDDSADSPAETARALGRLAERLSPDWNRPERFHERKSALIAAIRKLARRLDQGPGR